MICHVCRGEAVGQCKGCGKFYCPQHGDTYCVRCRDLTPGKKRLDDLDDLPGKPLGGLGCARCHGPASGACSRCGAFYCPEHGGMDRMNGRSFCWACQQWISARVRLAAVLLTVFVVAWVFFGITIVIRQSRWAPTPFKAVPDPPIEVIHGFTPDGPDPTIANPPLRPGKSSEKPF